MNRFSATRQRAIAQVKAQMVAAETTLRHRAIELDQLLRDQAAEDARTEARRDRFGRLTRGMRGRW